MNIRELKTLLKENKINFYTNWDKKRLIAQKTTLILPLRLLPG